MALRAAKKILQYTTDFSPVCVEMCRKSQLRRCPLRVISVQAWMSTQLRLLMLSERSLWVRGKERGEERVWGREGWGTEREREREGARLLHARIPHFIAGWTLLCDVCCRGASVALCEVGVNWGVIVKTPPFLLSFRANAGGFMVIIHKSSL